MRTEESTIDTPRAHSKHELARQVGSTFQCTVAEGVTVPALLTDVTTLPASPGSEQFSLYFTLPVDTPPLQRIYDMDHPVIGPVQWFLVPIGRDANGLQVEAAFNRRITDSPEEG